MKQSTIITFFLPSLGAATYPTSLIYKFPPNSWLENLAVRSCGSILTTMFLPDARLYEFDPKAKAGTEPKLVAKFPSSMNALGITETSPDTFIVGTSNFSIATLSAAPNSNQIWRVAFPGPKVELITTVSPASFLNGITTLNPRTVLAADSSNGSVYSIDTVTGRYRKVIADDPLMAPAGSLPIGIDGLHVHGDELYFTNFAQGFIGKVCIHPDGSAAGPAVKVTPSPPAAALAQNAYDDFTFGATGHFAYSAVGGANVIRKVNLWSGKTEVVAGDLNSTELAEPTSAQFGRTPADRETLYVTTGGGLVAPVYANGTKYQGIGGQLVAVKLACR